MRDYQSKQNKSALPDTINNERLGAGEFNSIANELEAAVTSSDQALAPADGTGEVTDQLAKALAIYGAGGAAFHIDTGAADAYVLTPVSPKESPPAYFDGFIIIFSPTNDNTGASTVNVGALGVKALEVEGGLPLTGGELVAGTNVVARYNLAGDRFELLISGYIRLPQIAAGNALQNIQVNEDETGFELVGPLYGLKNKIINGNFNFWQRNTTQTSNGQSSDDKWYNDNVGSTKTASRFAFTVGAAGNPTGEPRYHSRTVVASVADAANYVAKTQHIESVRTFSGQQATLSFWAKADASKNIATELTQYFGTSGGPSAEVTAIGVTTHALTTSWQKFTATVNIPSILGKTIGTDNNDYLQLLFWFDAGSSFNARTNSLGQQSGTFDIAQVQLETGPSATIYDFRLPAIELMLCQRYFQKSYDVATVPGTIVNNGRQDFYLSGLTAANYSAGIFTNFPVTMRAVPTVTVYSPTTGASGVVDMTGGQRAPTLIVAGEASFDVAAAEPVASGPHSINYHYTADAEL